MESMGEDRSQSVDACGLELAELAAWGDFYRAADPDLARRYGIRVEERGGALISVVGGTDVLALNRVVGLGLETAPDEADVDELVGEYARVGARRFFAQLSPTITDLRLIDLLRERGFRHYNNWVKLERDVAVDTPRVETDLRVRRIGAGYARDFGDIVARCFGWPEELAGWVSALVERDGWHHYMAFDGESPVATGAFFVAEDHAWIGFAATLPEYRNRGAQRALLARRIRDAERLGCGTLVVEAAEETDEKRSPSLNNLLAFGFRVAYVRPNYIYVVAREGYEDRLAPQEQGWPRSSQPL